MLHRGAGLVRLDLLVRPLQNRVRALALVTHAVRKPGHRLGGKGEPGSWDVTDCRAQRPHSPAGGRTAGSSAAVPASQAHGFTPKLPSPSAFSAVSYLQHREIEFQTYHFPSFRNVFIKI